MRVLGLNQCQYIPQIIRNQKKVSFDIMSDVQFLNYGQKVKVKNLSFC